MGSGLRQAAYGLAGLMAASPAAARSPVSELELHYSAPEGCPDEAVFTAHLRRRSPDLRLGGQGRPRVEVDVYRDPFQGVGTLTVTDDDDVRTERRVEASSCDDVVTALALVTAVALEQHGAGSGSDAESEKLDSPATSSAPADGIDVVAVEGYRIPVADAPADPWRAALGPPGPKSWWGTGFQVGAVVGVLPKVAFAPRLFVDARLDRRGPWTPSARLSAARAMVVAGRDDGFDRSVKLVWTAGRADVCPISFELGPTELWPCGTFEAGWADVADGGGSPASSGRGAWIALGSVTRLQWIVREVLLLEVEAGGEAPLKRPELLRRQPLALYTSVGLGGRFP